jgi:murein DD-endopeptidase MepM/ murein hydrolase activator NlpD
MIRRSLALGLLVLMVPTAGYAHPQARQATKSKTVHVVRSGETLALLAKRYGSSVKALAEANRLVQPDRLRVGQQIVIPEKEDHTVAQAPEKQASQGGGAPAQTVRTPAQSVGSTGALTPPRYFVFSTPDFDGRAPAFGWPVAGPVSSQFGRRRSGWHAGIDIKAEVGTPVFAAASGTVYYSGWEKRYGLVVKIQHAEGFVTVYAHNLQNFVETGDEVARGQVIGTIGRTGRASSYHLHFEIRNNGKVYNPLHFLPPPEVAAELEEATQPEEPTQPEDEGDEE